MTEAEITNDAGAKLWPVDSSGNEHEDPIAILPKGTRVRIHHPVPLTLLTVEVVDTGQIGSLAASDIQ